MGQDARARLGSVQGFFARHPDARRVKLL
jgi:hypothetical protein